MQLNNGAKKKIGTITEFISFFEYIEELRFFNKS